MTPKIGVLPPLSQSVTRTGNNKILYRSKVATMPTRATSAAAKPPTAAAMRKTIMLEEERCKKEESDAKDAVVERRLAALEASGARMAALETNTGSGQVGRDIAELKSASVAIVQQASEQVATCTGIDTRLSAALSRVADDQRAHETLIAHMREAHATQLKDSEMQVEKMRNESVQQLNACKDMGADLAAELARVTLQQQSLTQAFDALRASQTQHLSECQRDRDALNRLCDAHHAHQLETTAGAASVKTLAHTVGTVMQLLVTSKQDRDVQVSRGRKRGMSRHMHDTISGARHSADGDDVSVRSSASESSRSSVLEGAGDTTAAPLSLPQADVLANSLLSFSEQSHR